MSERMQSALRGVCELCCAMAVGGGVAGWAVGLGLLYGGALGLATVAMLLGAAFLCDAVVAVARPMSRGLAAGAECQAQR